MTNQHARALGKLGKGKPKTLTQAERRRRAERLAKARELRWRTPDEKNSAKLSKILTKESDRIAKEHGPAKYKDWPDDFRSKPKIK